MYFPKFWVCVRQGAVHTWGWSDVSAAEAQAEGQARLARVLERLSAGRVPSKWVDPYGYPDRPMREEVIHQFVGGDNTDVVTRNSYGCLVLNTARALFADVDEDFQPAERSFLSLFRKRPPLDDVILERARNWVETQKDWGWRIYRTKAGFRLLATHRPVLPDDPAADAVFRVFNADILYRKLCVNQRCYRARLTPKSWRCGMDRLVQRWPWVAPEDEAAFREWEKAYRKASADYATCHLLGQVGNAAIHPDLAALVEFHDKATGVGSSRPLA